MGLGKALKGLFKYATICIEPTDEEIAHTFDRCKEVPYKGYGVSAELQRKIRK